jgi:hypothetical protein
VDDYMGPPDKWLRLLVSGHNVPKALGEEIILATFQPDRLHLNDKVWERYIARTFELELDEHGWVSEESAKLYRARVGGLELHWMGNEQIGSSWIGGPHGWVDWDGKVGCGSYNLGKYPSNDEITEDLRLIAARWPSLKLWVQVVDSEGEGPVSGEWKVEGGKAERFKNMNYRHVTPKIELDGHAAVLGLYRPDRERGVEAAALLAAYRRVRLDR